MLGVFYQEAASNVYYVLPRQHVVMATQSPVDYMRHHQFFLVVDSLLSFPAINYIFFFQGSIIMTDVEELISHDLFC